MRLAGAAGLALAIFLSATSVASAAPVATLGEGQSAFWPGAFVGDSRVDDPSACGIEGACFDYPIAVTATNARVLRVAVASSEDSNGWDVRLLDPSGAVVATGSTWESEGVAQDYDAELFARNPVSGTWTMQVIAKNVHLGDFEARAAVDPPTFAPAASAPCTQRTSETVHIPASVRRAGIKSLVVYVDGRRQRTLHGSHSALKVSLLGLPVEVARIRIEVATRKGNVRVARRAYTCAAPARAAGVVDMPPDIAADPPWHITFDQPTPMLVVESGNLTGIAGVHEPTMQVGDTPIYGCLPEETAEQGAHRCLRFTSGFASLGPGPFTVYGESKTFASPTGGPLKQVITRSDGSTYSRAAGSYVFHPIHAHYHVLGIAQFRFFRVNPAEHTLTDAGTVLKEGFCLGDIKIYDWQSFAQEEAHKIVGNCEPAQQPDGTYRFYEGISNGWEDSYKWATSGQFVDVSNDPDGYYLLRIDVNAEHKLLETTYADNTAYAYMEIRGNTVRVIERGHGEGPWDPAKVVEDPVITH